MAWSALRSSPGAPSVEEEEPLYQWRPPAAVAAATALAAGCLPSRPGDCRKAAIKALPTVSVSSLKGRTNADKEKCAICPTAFVEGDQLRVLPRCAHGFHLTCRTPRQHRSLLLLRACFHLGRSME